MPASKSNAVDQYKLNGRLYRVDPQAKLGSGSEGMVIEHPVDPTRCVKIFHPPEVGDVAAAKLAAYRAEKVQAVCAAALRLSLPSQFTQATTPAYDTADKVCGFDMARVSPRHFKLMKLLESSFRTDHQITLATISLLFADLFEDLTLIHGRQLRVGDVNLGCVLFEPGKGRAWVDTDSWSFEDSLTGKSYPCLATTEMFCHPDLYANLAGGHFVAPLPTHDRFAFIVAYIMTALPGAHPFRMGTHPTVKGLQNRTKAGLTIFDSAVTFPPMLGTPNVMSDTLLHELITRLKRQNNQPLDPQLLRTFADELCLCSQCGLEYHKSRPACPKCQTKTISIPTVVDFIIETLAGIPGALLFAQPVDKNIYLICRFGNEVKVIRVDERGASTTFVPSLPNVPGARYRFFKDCLVYCPDPTKSAPIELVVYRLEGVNLRRAQDTTTGVLAGEGATFDTSSRYLYRTAANGLMKVTLYGQGMLYDTQIAEVHQRQSWFTADRMTGADREVICGHDRALREWQWFIIVGNSKGESFQYHSIGDLNMRRGEKTEDFAVYFAINSVLIIQRTSYRGRTYIRYAIVGLDGKIQSDKLIDADDPTFALWENLRGKLYQGPSVLHVTPMGVVKQQFSDESCIELPDTTNRVSRSDRLFRFNGQVFVLGQSKILVLQKKVR